ncbi:galactokinase [Acidicapsa acidisoli]|uniref:galactokinase n=1 Tax=Acidicapsa acidisoli TaxID=1615681 RepID=UPI0021DFE79F|nr:galactokinase [Acidicapsa acidisoli]
MQVETAAESLDPLSSDCGYDQQYFAPGRVNLIGEHTDYTGGLVLPMAIPFQSTASIATNCNSAYEFTSNHFSTQRRLHLDEEVNAIGDWSDYCVGVLQQLRNRGIEIAPFRLHIGGNVPIGAGLSSSASIEVATIMALLAHAKATMAVEEMAILCRRAENEFVGSPCGIMDQFVILAAHSAHALLLHTSSLRNEHLSLQSKHLSETRIIVVNSMVKHSIAAGDYGVRRREVESGQQILREHFPELADLGQASLGQLETRRASMSPESYRRCRHIISENDRVRGARAAILADDPGLLGDLMTRSHVSQRDDFACSCEEIDFLVDCALRQPGCFGARLTGGGFGGCTVNLVAADHAEAFVAAVTRDYKGAFKIDAASYVCEAAAGAVAQNSSSDCL